MLIVGHVCVCNFFVLIASISYFYGTYMRYRVETYIQGGLDKDIVDPDDGENIRRKRRRLGIDTDDQHDAAGSVAIDQFMFPPSTASLPSFIP